MCASKKLRILKFQTCDSDNKEIRDSIDESISDKEIELSEQSGKDLIPGNEYIFKAAVKVNKDQGYEIYENLNHLNNTHLDFVLKCSNGDVECSNIYLLDTNSRPLIINKDTWTSGLTPDSAFYNFKEKWSKEIKIEFKYSVKRKMKTLKDSDIEITYEIKE